MNDTERLGQWLRDSDNIVFFGGAGVSTESNIPDFRSAVSYTHLDVYKRQRLYISTKASSVLEQLSFANVSAIAG